MTKKIKWEITDEDIDLAEEKYNKLKDDAIASILNENPCVFYHRFFEYLNIEDPVFGYKFYWSLVRSEQGREKILAISLDMLKTKMVTREDSSRFTAEECMGIFDKIEWRILENLGQSFKNDIKSPQEFAAIELLLNKLWDEMSIQQNENQEETDLLKGKFQRAFDIVREDLLKRRKGKGGQQPQEFSLKDIPYWDKIKANILLHAEANIKLRNHFIVASIYYLVTTKKISLETINPVKDSTLARELAIEFGNAEESTFRKILSTYKKNYCPLNSGMEKFLEHKSKLKQEYPQLRFI